MKSFLQKFAATREEDQKKKQSASTTDSSGEALMSFWSCGASLTDLISTCSFWDETALDIDYDYNVETNLKHRQRSMQYPQDQDITRCSAEVELSSGATIRAEQEQEEEEPTRIQEASSKSPVRDEDGFAKADLKLNTPRSSTSSNTRTKQTSKVNESSNRNFVQAE